MSSTSKSSARRFIAFAFSWFFLALGLFFYACAGSQVQVQNPTELCAQALAMSSEVRTQAAKVGLEPIELARRTCDAAILATKLLEANLPHLEGVAGATNSPSMALAGAAGSGG